MRTNAVLVVEDDATLAHAITRNLTVRGYTSTAALTVAEAVESVRERCPDLLVLDIDLPDGSGWDVAREVRARAMVVPIIVISALRPKHQLTKELACIGFLEKPFPMVALIRVIESSLPSNTVGGV